MKRNKTKRHDWKSYSQWIMLALVSAVAVYYLVASPSGTLLAAVGQILSVPAQVTQTVVFATLAFGLAMLLLWCIKFPYIQRVMLPYYDELHDLTELWKKGKLTPCEAELAKAYAIYNGLTTLGVLFMVGMLATFL